MPIAILAPSACPTFLVYRDRRAATDSSASPSGFPPEQTFTVDRTRGVFLGGRRRDWEDTDFQDAGLEVRIHSCGMKYRREEEERLPSEGKQLEPIRDSFLVNRGVVRNIFCYLLSKLPRHDITDIQKA